MAHLGRALTTLTDPPVKALVVYNSNPAAIAPDQTTVRKGFEREDLFTVVLEQFQTDTADYADILLPVTTFLEHTDLYRAYGHYYLQLARPALEPPGETKSNVEIFRLLAHKLGFQDECFLDTEDDMICQALSSGSKFLEGITFEQLERERSVRLNLGFPQDPFLPFANGGFRTPSQKFNFGAQQLAYAPPVESRLGDPELVARYPLEFVSAKNDDSMNSTFGHRPAVDRQTSICELSEVDAARAGIVSGDRVRVFNGRGECYFDARVSDSVKVGLIRARSVRWNKFSPLGVGVNSLTTDRLTDIGRGPTFYSCLVQVERCGSEDQ
jgi:anaerobic selenocysteine-containing dehydrogenase